MELHQVGSIISSFKLEGGVKILISTDFPNERFKLGNEIRIIKGNEEKIMTIDRFEKVGNNFILYFNEIKSKEEADKLKGAILLMNKDASLLNKNQYFFSDLIDCQVINQENIIIGKVIKIEEYPSQLTLRIKRTGKQDVLIPFVKAFIKSVNIKEKKILVNTIGGML